MDAEKLDSLVALAKTLPELVQKLTDATNALAESTNPSTPNTFSKEDLDSAVEALTALVPATGAETTTT